MRKYYTKYLTFHGPRCIVFVMMLCLLTDDACRDKNDSVKLHLHIECMFVKMGNIPYVIIAGFEGVLSNTKVAEFPLSPK